MRFLLALAAFALALMSVTTASSACMGEPDISHTEHASASGADCHHASESGAAAGDVSCNQAAHCAFLCGVTPPAGPDDLVSPASLALNFIPDFQFPAGAGLKPESPPPRFVSL